MLLITQSGQTGEFGELTINNVSFPTYTCGHCTFVVVMRPDRVRARRTCPYCGRMVCDKEICDPSAPGGGCTPLYAISDDKFEGRGPEILRAKAIMQGATTLDEVQGDM